VYDYDIHLQIGGELDAFQKKLLKGLRLPAEPAGIGDYLACTICPEHRTHGIWFSEPRPALPVISHEALHSVGHVLRQMGFGPMTEELEETYAYLLMWTVEEIWNRVCQKRP